MFAFHDSILQSARPARNVYAHLRAEEMRRPAAQHIARRVAGWTGQAVSEAEWCSARQALQNCWEAGQVLSWMRLACKAVPTLRQMGDAVMLVPSGAEMEMATTPCRTWASTAR